MTQITRRDIEAVTGRAIRAAIRAGIVPEGYKIDIQPGSRLNGNAWGFLHRSGAHAYSRVPFIPSFNHTQGTREVHAALTGVAVALECVGTK